MATHPRVEATGSGGEAIPEEMMAELKKEIARNVEATKLVKQREIEATSARDKAADSQRRMEEMMVKYEEMKHKLEWTRVTLAETHQRLEKHNNSRSERLRQSVEQLKVRTTETQQKLFERNHRGSPANQGTEGGSQKSEGTEDVNAGLMGGLGAFSMGGGGGGSEDGGLTDAERMLLKMCQDQAAESQAEKEQQAASAAASVIAEPTTGRPDAGLEPAQRLRNASKDYAKTVEALQKKLSSSSKRKSTDSTDSTDKASANSAIPEESSPSQAEQDQAVNMSSKTARDSSSTVDQSPDSSVPERSSEAVSVDPAAAYKRDEAVPGEASPTTPDHDALTEALADVMTVTAADTTASATASAVADATDASQPKSASSDRDSHEVKMDLNVEMVAAVEAKVASVRETLGEMAMSEQYMRTKRAQLLARTREREAQLATALAEQKEKEAEEMRQKVKKMMLLLDERRNKLRATVDVLQKKSGVVDKVNKILDTKERRANYVEKQRDECLAFDKKPKKN